MLPRKPRFTSPPDPEAFKRQVWEIVRHIPPGRVTTYGKVAAMISPPSGMNLKDYLAFGARWVGGAMASCPDDVPWQRVINAQGKISVRRGEGAVLQKQLLEDEGVKFVDKDRVNLSHFGWDEVMEE